MKKIVQTLKFIDIFGVPVRLLTDQSEEKFVSIYGGLISIIISTLSTIYFIYIMNIWLSGSIIPNISLNQQAIEYQEFQWNSPIIYFTSQDPASTIDPFSQKNNIITPLLFTLIDEQIIDKPQVLLSDNPSIINLNNGYLILNNFNSSVQSDQYQKSHIYLLIFAECKEAYMNENSSCANQETIHEYLNSFHGFLSISINLQQFNYITKQFETVTKTVYQAISPDQDQFTSISMKVQETIIDDGILLENKNYYSTINNFEMMNQAIGQNYASNIVSWFAGEQYEIDSIVAFQIQIDSIKVISHITMPKLNTILAEIGSIVQVIFMLKYLAYFMNRKFLNYKLLHQILQMYYPDLKNITIKRNILGKVIQGHYKNQAKTINSQFVDQYSKLQKIALQKVRLTNIIYEISRMQFILQQLHGIEIITGSHIFGSQQKFTQEAVLEFSNRASIVPEEIIEQEDFNTIIKILIK